VDQASSRSRTPDIVENELSLPVKIHGSVWPRTSIQGGHADTKETQSRSKARRMQKVAQPYGIRTGIGFAELGLGLEDESRRITNPPKRHALIEIREGGSRVQDPHSCGA